MTQTSPARTSGSNGSDPETGAAAVDRAVAAAWQMLTDAADTAAQATGGPVRIDVDPRAWADEVASQSQAIGRVLLNASVEAERLISIAQNARLNSVALPAPQVDRPEFEPPPVAAPPMEPSTVAAPLLAPEVLGAPVFVPPPPFIPPPFVPPPFVPPGAEPTGYADGGARPVRAGRPGTVRPITMPEGISRPRAAIATGLTWIVGAAIITLLFVAYQLWGTGLSEERAQKSLANQFQVALAHAPAHNNQATTTKLITSPPLPPLPGGVIGRIQIPHIGVDKYIVEGTERDDLEKGPGHYVGSSMPGHPGNAAIAGHRTTYGAPFNRLDELDVGDKIFIQTVEGKFLYTVSQKPFPVSPYDNTVVQDYGDNRLTLTTCNPKFSAAQRLIVVAKFSGAVPKQYSVKEKLPRTAAHPVTPAATDAQHVKVNASDGWGNGELPLVMFWLLVVIGLGLAYRPLRRRWPALAVYVVVIPAWACVLFLFFEQLNRFLPANL